MKRLLLITLLIGYIYPCVAQDKPIRTEESLEGTVIYSIYNRLLLNIL